MKISKAVRREWDALLSDYEVQGLRNEADTLLMVPAEYGRLRVLYKAETDAASEPEGPDPSKLRPELPELVIGGYASPQVVDKEKHLITREALAKDLPRFLAHPHHRNCMVVHTNIQVGEVLPEWTHPETGETYRTKVDDIGLFTVVKVRTDPFRPTIVDQVIKDIESGELAAFSISGDAPHESRRHTCANGACFWIIDEIELYEVTLLTTEDALIDVPGGRIPVAEVRVGDQVITHRRRPRMVTQTGKTAFEGVVVEIEEEDGSVVRVSPEHKVRAKKPGMGRPVWIPASDLEVGDEVVTRSRIPVRNRRGGIKTPEGRARQVASATSDAFRRKRSEIMRLQWQDPHYRAAALAKLEESAPKRRKRSKKAQRNISNWLRKMRQEPAFNEAMFKAMRLSPNKVELALQGRLGPLGFWYTGDGKLVTRSGLVPDFWNGDGRVVELFGDYWHAGQDPEERIARLKKDGYECLVLWEREVKADLVACARRVEEFCRG